MPYLPPIREEQYPATDETQCIQIIIPAGDEFKALLAGLIVEATDVMNYADPESASADGLAAIWDQAYSEIDWSGCPMPEIAVHRADVFSRFSAVSGGTLTRTLSSFPTFGYYMSTDVTASREMTDTVYLSAGSWEYRGITVKTVDAGINFVRLTPVGAGFITLVDNFDQYGLLNQEWVLTTSFELSESGLFTILTENTGSKNASSSGYRVNWTSHHFWRVA